MESYNPMERTIAQASWSRGPAVNIATMVAAATVAPEVRVPFNCENINYPGAKWFQHVDASVGTFFGVVDEARESNTNWPSRLQRLTAALKLLGTGL